MLEEIQKGVSGKNDFYRHLSNFITKHKNIILLGLTSSTYNNDLWNKLITHKVYLQRVKSGTIEEKEGFEFVACIENDIIPFSIGNSGILC